MSEPGPVALTGATGFLGAAIARALEGRGRRVRALARNPARLPALRDLEAVPGDLADEAALERLCAGAEAVIHCAGVVKALSRAAFFEANALGAARIAGVAARVGAPRFTLISSLAAREPQLSDYAASKHAGEAAVRQAFPQAVILRPPAIYGPGDQEMARLFAFAKRGLLPCPGDGRGRLSFIHVEDAAEASLCAAFAEACAGRLYEIGDGAAEGYSWAEAAAALSQAVGRPVRLAPTPLWALTAAGAVAGAAARLTGEPSVFGLGKAREAAHPDWVARAGDLPADSGWSPRLGLNDGLLRTLSKWRADAASPGNLLSPFDTELR